MSPAAPLPSDEQERIAALHELGILDTATEERFDRLVRFVKQKLEVPIALNNKEAIACLMQLPL